jgi:transcriptional antiterminator NusG
VNQYYVCRIKTGREKVFQEQANQILDFRSEAQRFFFPQRELPIRRRGKHISQLKPIFPGYIFLETAQADPELYRAVRPLPDFIHFLRDNSHITALADRDLALIRHFLSFGTVAGKSQVFFDENDRIVVTAGPLKGLEGSILKVDKRKKRAKIRLDFSSDNFVMDLAFEAVSPVKGILK